MPRNEQVDGEKVPVGHCRLLLPQPPGLMIVQLPMAFSRCAGGKSPDKRKSRQTGHRHG
jgi:hypothetical protein